MPDYTDTEVIRAIYDLLYKFSKEAKMQSTDVKRLTDKVDGILEALNNIGRRLERIEKKLG